MNRKVAYIIHGIAVGGAELAFLSALPALHKGYDLRVIVLGRSNPELLAKLDRSVRKVMIFLEIPSYLFPFYLFSIYRLLIRFRPDVVISSLWRSTLPAVMYRILNQQIKYFVMIHNTAFFHIADRVFTIYAIKKADIIFADSAASQVFVENLIEGKKPVWKLSYLTVPTPKHIVKKRFDMKFSFYFMGSLNTVKRVPLAVKAIAWLRHQGIDASLHIYGRFGNDEQALRSEIEKSGVSEAIAICGEVAPDEKSKVYQCHNCYIQLSAYEGMAMSVAEAMQQGMLCVLTPVGEIPNYAIDGKNAIFMDVTDGGVSEQSLGNLLSILKDKERCEAISSAAHGRFKDAPLFAESLVEAIQRS